MRANCSERWRDGFKGIILPQANAPEAAVVEGLQVLAASTLRDVIAFLTEKHQLKQEKKK